jgi:hypothetical protein
MSTKDNTTDSQTLEAFSRGYRLALTLEGDELEFVQIPDSSNSAFAQGHRRGLERRARIGGHKIASALARQLLGQERINLRPVAR